MNAHTVGWLVLLMTLMKDLSCYEDNPFILEDEQIPAVEGSCVEIKCKPGRHVYGLDGAHWFWMKDATWNAETRDFVATTIYSSDESKRPVDPLFKNRVRNIDSSSLSWYHRSSKSETLCNILICDLKKTDSGNYLFRFHGINKQWVTRPETNLTVVENPCPITFKGPQVVKENEMVTLTCSTLSSCPSNPQMDTLTQRPAAQLGSLNTESPKSVTRRFNFSWKDDGIVFSCQTADNSDKYLVRNINLTVEYAPKETEAKRSSDHVRKGDFVALTCSAKGRPPVNFSWFKNDQKLTSGAELTFTSIKASDSGSYLCEAENKIGTGKSNTLYIDLSSPPTNVNLSMPATVREGQSVTVACTADSFPPSSFTVEKSSTSNPESVFPHAYGQNPFHHTFTAAPTHAGSYVCTASNSKGTAKSEEKNLEVQYSPKHTAIIKGGERQLSDGRRSVTLTCISPCYPPATYVWYNKTDDREVLTSKSQNITVKSDQAGEYYCTARNEMGQRSSEPIRLFDEITDRNKNLMMTVRPFLLICCLLVFILLLFFLFRRWRNKSVQRGSIHTRRGFLGWWKGARRQNVISEGDLAERSGSRDEYLSRPPNRLKTQRPQPRPDATSAPTMSTVSYLPNRNQREKAMQADYENVTGVHAAKPANPPNPRNSDLDTSDDSSSSEDDYCQAPPPQVPKRRQHGNTEDDSLNYVLLDFGNKLKNAKEEVVYSVVSKPEPVKTREKERRADYENASVAQAARSPNHSNPCDSDTSEDEAVVSYTQVDLKPESGHQRASRDSGSSEDELQYSQVKT